ncbi:SNF1-related protein kinase regulatory subunit beta-2-like [Phoenix dactylifera]|uniref:SNF1-related protein kinase regulatory subunit beta-2-like n=1 Tax=Phoenix dactylifera TaxID=42345 RepID=A0A8B9AAG3_PHODC|nr:SNF1-related protein kinase regulatory subunit beta-2-like [Phoenix dactylifera]XP_038983565.1 SNF1-related protein kinase regulatory subunit beta-2-like [Phoenix dactylifera]
MGNVSSIREGEEEGRQQEGEGQALSSQSRGKSEDLMGQSPPQSPRRAARSPLLFTPQNPAVPLQRLEEMHSASDSWMQGLTEYENVIYDQGIPTMITWSHGGKEVFVEGSWDNWKTKKPLQKSGKDFTIMKVLPSGFYQYRFIVDGEWRYAPDIPWMHDDIGNAYNILDLKEFVAEDIESIAGFEPPQSPDSSYNNWPLGSEDFAKEPPIVPPQLHLTLLNAPADIESPSSLSRPPHVVLNHLYIQKGRSGQPMVALGATRRFLSKYVTVVLYKSLQR